MNKNDLALYVAEASGLSKADATRAVDAVINGITEGLITAGEVKISGLGTFSVSERAATTGRNPRTGEEIQIAASKNAKFKAAKQLKDSVNDNATASNKKAS